MSGSATSSGGRPSLYGITSSSGKQYSHYTTKGAQTSGGSGGGEGGMERIARLESDMAHMNRSLADIKADVRDTRNWLIGLFLFTASGFAGVYLSLDGKIDGVAKDVSAIELNMVGFDAKLVRVEAQLSDLQVAIDGMERGVSALVESQRQARAATPEAGPTQP